MPWCRARKSDEDRSRIRRLEKMRRVVAAKGVMVVSILAALAALAAAALIAFAPSEHGPGRTSRASGATGATLINSNMFVNMAGQSTSPPTDIVCQSCTFGGNAAHTVSIQDSIRSGVIDSVICQAKYPALSLDIGPDAVDPVNQGNRIILCSSGLATLSFTPPSRAVIYKR